MGNNKIILGEGSRCTQLIGISIGAATLENSMEVTQKTKNRTTFEYILSMYHKTETTNHKSTRNPIFTEALFTIVKIWKQTRCPSTGEWIKNMWYTHTRTYIHTH